MRVLVACALLFLQSSPSGVAAKPRLAQASDEAPPEPPTQTVADAVASSETASETPHVREHAEEIASYTLSVRADPVHHTLSGSGSLRFHNPTDKTLTSIWVHLYLNAFKNERSVFLREPTGPFRGSTSPKSWGTIDVKSFRDGALDLWERAHFAAASEGDETDVEIPLEIPIEPGASRTFEMVWESTLPSIVLRTGFADSFHFAGQWFPKLAKIEADGTFAHFPFHHLSEFYADFGRYDVTISVPQEFIIGATGPLVEHSQRDGRRVERHVQSDIHDFAFTFWDKFQERSETIAGVAVRGLFPKGYDAVMEREFATLRFAIPHFADRYGIYPYPTLTVVHPPETDASEAGGMEYPTLITTGGDWYTPPNVRTIELVTIHEFGHQYFFGLLASNENRFPFLDEGLNSYAESEALEAWLGTSSAGSLWGLEVSDTSVQAAGARDIGQDEPVADGASQFLSGRHYGRLVYSRTATILQTLRRVHGDTAMQNMLRAYALDARLKHPTPASLLTHIATRLGETARQNAQLALFEKGWVDYRVAAVTRGRSQAPAGIFDDGGKRETRTSQAGAAKHSGHVTIVRRGTLQFPVDVELTYDGGARELLHWDGSGSAAVLSYENTTRLSRVRVDPEHRILLDENPTNQHSGAPGAMGKGFDYVAFFAEALWRILLP
jgi:Peptidase family M1 domain